MEHRWGERIALEVPVRLTVPPFAVRQGSLTDASVSGGFIRSAAELRPLARIQAAIAARRLPGAVLPAYVARICREGAGVEWCEFAPPVILDLIRDALRHERAGVTWRLRPLLPPDAEPLLPRTR